MPNETPNLHLSRVGTADEIRNWEKIDAILAVLAAGIPTTIPGDLEVQGALVVDGTSNLKGYLTAQNVNVNGLLAVLGETTFAQAVLMQQGLTVASGPVALPPASLAPSVLPVNFSVHAWATAQSTNLQITPTPQLIASVLVPGASGTNLELLIAEMVTLVTSPGGAGAQANIQVVLRYGGTTGLDGTVQTTRTYSVSSPTAATAISVPIIVPRFAAPPDTTSPHRWVLEAFQLAGTGAWTVTATLANLTVIQLG
jgi:hypothetical protein